MVSYACIFMNVAQASPLLSLTPRHCFSLEPGVQTHLLQNAEPGMSRERVVQVAEGKKEEVPVTRRNVYRKPLPHTGKEGKWSVLTRKQRLQCLMNELDVLSSQRPGKKTAFLKQCLNRPEQLMMIR